jgi:hypothetical protein
MAPDSEADAIVGRDLWLVSLREGVDSKGKKVQVYDTREDHGRYVVTQNKHCHSPEEDCIFSLLAIWCDHVTCCGKEMCAEVENASSKQKL